MSCIILKNGLESSLHQKLINKYGKSIADEKIMFFQTESFLKDFGDYESLMEKKLDYIPKEFNGRLNEKFEPELFEDSSGLYYIDLQYEKQYIDVIESSLYDILQSQRAVNSLVDILANNYIEKGGFNLDFDTLVMSDNKSNQSLLESIKERIQTLSDQLIESENDLLFTNGVAILQILDDNKALEELVNKIKNVYKSKNLLYNEDYSHELVDEETNEQRDPVFNQASFKVNPKNKMTAMVKIRLSMIKNPTDLDEDFGQPKSIDYDSLYNKMTAILKDNPVTITNRGQKNEKVEDLFKTIINKLKSHSNNVKYLGNVASYLENIDGLNVDLKTNEGINIQNFKAGFVNVMTLQKNVLEYSEVIPKETIISEAITEPKVLANGAIKNVVVKEAIKGTEYIYKKRDATSDTKVEKSILLSWELTLLDFFNLNKDNKTGLSNVKSQQYIKIKDRISELLKDTTLSNKEKVDTVLTKLLPYVGLNINEASFNYAINGLDNVKLDEARLNQNYYYFLTGVQKTFDNLLTNYSKDQDIFNDFWFRQIAKAEAFYREDGSESSVFTAGETRYIYSNPSYLHNKVNAWKKDRQLLLDEYNNKSNYEKGSSLYEHLLALDIKNNPELQLKTSEERIQNFGIHHFSSFMDSSNKSAKQKTNKDISINEYVVDTINGLLHSHIDGYTHSRTTTAPGKSTQYNIQHKMFVDSGFDFIFGEPEISTTVNLLYDKYLKAEFDRMIEQYKVVRFGKDLKVYYHTNKKFQTLDNNGKLVGNAFKSQLFPSLSFDKIDSVIKIDLQRPLYSIDGSLIAENILYYKEDILKFIEKSVLEHIDILKSDLIKYNVVEKAGENKYVVKGIDSRILNAKGYRTDKYYFSEEDLFKLMGDIWLNGLVNHIEYSKLFSGDVAYYKDSVDYIKRIGASYTDGIYEYLSDINKDFKIGVVESVEYREPYLEELKDVIKSDIDLVKAWEEDVNAADAQAWITPRRWKSLMLGVGKFTTQHEQVYNKLIGKDTEALTKEELKLVAQPLKGVYFEQQTDGAPAYLKYSQAVLLPQIRNNSKLKDIYDFMEHHKIDELLTFDAIKAGSVVPTKIHTQNGQVEVRDSEGKFKPLNTLTLSSRGWKLQQDLPTKTYKETDIGSQILKNMLLLISDKLNTGEKIFEYQDNAFTAEEFASILDTTLGQLVIEGYNDLVREFDINEDGVIGNTEKFYKTLANEIVDRNGSNELIKALNAKLSIYAMPGLKNKLDNIFASIVNDRTVKIKTNGGSFIQMSNFGLSKDEADLKHKDIKWSPKLNQGDTVKPYTYKLNKDGSRAKNIFGEDIISPEQILISGSFISKYIPNYEDYTSEELFGYTNDNGEFVSGLIDSKILENIIGYRIPNQGPSSNGALEIVGILPPGVGDTIVAFTGITKKTGSDKISLFDPV